MPDGKYHISFDKRRVLEWAAILGFGSNTVINTFMGNNETVENSSVPLEIEQRIEVIEDELTHQGSEDYHLHKRILYIEDDLGYENWRNHDY